MPLTNSHWLIPLGVLLASVLWMFFVRRENSDIVELTSRQYLGDELAPIDVINLKRRAAGLPELDAAAFKEVYERNLAQIRGRYPISAYFARKRQI